MNYPSPAYGAAPLAVGAKAGTSKTAIIVGVIIGAAVFLGAVAIGLGVGLGVGLNKNNGGSTLSAPTVVCNSSNVLSGDTCGCPTTTPTFSSRIFSGNTATTSSWPWMVVVKTASRTCSGFLVSEQHVVTAANCVYGVTTSNIIVYLGITKISDTANGVTRYVTNVTIPAGYSTSSSYKDIAVLKLNSNVTLGSTIATCCYSFDTSVPAVDQHAVIAGWGETSLISGVSDSLRQAVVQVQTPSTCGLSATNDTLFCAGYGSVRTCPGDNGGPLMTSTNNTWTCSGVIIGGSNTCFLVGGYTRVSSFYDFISDATLY